MPTQHPSWCVGTEPAETDHVSKTVHAGGEEDPIDIQLRLSQPELETGDVTRWTTLEVEFVDYGESVTYPLDLEQARALALSLARLLSTAFLADATVGNLSDLRA